MRLKQSLPQGEKENFRKVLGINLSNEVYLGKEDRSGMAEKVKNFFDREDVSQVCPDTRKFKTDPESGEKVPLRYRFHYLTLLHMKFLAETSEECCYETFTRHVPYYVVKPEADEWGTCLCLSCLNPEIKLAKLKKLNKISVVNVEEVLASSDKYEKLKKDLMNLKPTSEKEKKKKKLDDILQQQEIDPKSAQIDKLVVEQDKIAFAEWGKEKYVTKKGKIALRSRKINKVETMNKFLDQLLKELEVLKEHLNRAHMQYKAFKEKSPLTTSRINTRYTLCVRGRQGDHFHMQLCQRRHLTRHQQSLQV